MPVIGLVVAKDSAVIPGYAHILVTQVIVTWHDTQVPKIQHYSYLLRT